MKELLRRFFGRAVATASGAEPAEHDIRVATCAILLEMATIDGEFNDAERDGIVSVMKRDHQLSDENVSALLEEANRELEGSVDLWQFTNLINRNYSKEEKLRIIETIWRLAYMDDRLHAHEDYLMHKLARLLRMTHKQLIEAKLKVIDP